MQYFEIFWFSNIIFFLYNMPNSSPTQAVIIKQYENTALQRISIMK